MKTVSCINFLCSRARADDIASRFADTRPKPVTATVWPPGLLFWFSPKSGPSSCQARQADRESNTVLEFAEHIIICTDGQDSG